MSRYAETVAADTRTGIPRSRKYILRSAGNIHAPSCTLPQQIGEKQMIRALGTAEMLNFIIAHERMTLTAG